MKAVTITHILSLGKERILISTDGYKTMIYNHAPSYKYPFMREGIWRELVHLKEIDNNRIVTSCLHHDFFILANDDCHFFMFDTIGYKIVD